jgi:transcriptional regulator with XRE-family HTH domain
MKPLDELMRTEGYWDERISNGLYRQMLRYKESHGLTDRELAARTGLSLHRVRQVLRGSGGGSLRDFIRASLSIGLAPEVTLEPLGDYIARAVSGE